MSSPTSPYKNLCMALGIAIMSNVPVILWGRPGEGKTSVLEQIAAHYRFWMETIIASICEPADFAGLPVVDHATGTVKLAPPQWAQNLSVAPAPDNWPVDLSQSTGGFGIAFYDEVSTAPPAVQAALLRPVLSNVVGALDMGKEIRTVAAANPADIAAGGWDLAPPMANRFLHLQWSLPADVIRDGFSIGFEPVPLPTPNPENVERLVRESKALVGSFIGSHPEIRSVLPDNSEDAGYAFPTPRSWEQAAKLYGYALACGVNSDVIQLLLVGSVGAPAAGEFLTYAASLDLPDPDEIIADPSKLVLPRERGDKVYAIAGSVLVSLVNNQTDERWRNVGHILGMMAEAGYGDLAFTYGRRWATMMPTTGVMPTPETVQHLGPVLAEIGAIVPAG